MKQVTKGPVSTTIKTEIPFPRFRDLLSGMSQLSEGSVMCTVVQLNVAYRRLGKAHMCFTPSPRNFPNVTFETDAIKAKFVFTGTVAILQLKYYI